MGDDRDQEMYWEIGRSSSSQRRFGQEEEMSLVLLLLILMEMSMELVEGMQRSRTMWMGGIEVV